MKRLLSLGVGLALLALGLVACAPAAAPQGAAPAGSGANKWEETLAAAKKEGKLVVVTHTDLYYRAVIDAFQKAYPEIQVEHVAMRPSEFTPKLLTEQQNGLFSYDVWGSPTSNMVTIALPAGAFQSMEPFLIQPDVKDTSNYLGNKLFWASKDPMILLDRGVVDSSVYVNRDVVPASQFNKMDDLLLPAMKGKYAIRTPNAPHGGSLTLTGMLNSKGDTFLRQVMIDQQPQYIDNAITMTQSLINGKIGVGVGIDSPTLDKCQAAGGCKNIEQVRGYDYLLGNGAAVMKNAPHPNATAVFVNFWFSKAGREASIKGMLETSSPPYTGAQSTRKDVTPHPDAIKNNSVPDYDHLEKYSLQGLEAGNAQMDAVIAMYKKAEAGGR